MIEREDENLITIGLYTAVYCYDEYCGLIHKLIVEQIGRQLTYLVVKPANLPALARRVERLVPFSHVTYTADDGLRLKCSVEEFRKFTPFTEAHFIIPPPIGSGIQESGFLPPMSSGPDSIYDPATKQNTVPGEIVIGRQVQIEALNGHLGQFEAFVVYPQTGEISHLVFLRGHMWERNRVTVVASVIDTLEGDTIYLNIKKSDLTHR